MEETANFTPLVQGERSPRMVEYEKYVPSEIRDMLTFSEKDLKRFLSLDIRVDVDCARFLDCDVLIAYMCKLYALDNLLGFLVLYDILTSTDTELSEKICSILFESPIFEMNLRNLKELSKGSSAVIVNLIMQHKFQLAMMKRLDLIEKQIKSIKQKNYSL